MLTDPPEKLDDYETMLLEQIRTLSLRMMGVQMHTYLASCSADAYQRYGVAQDDPSAYPDIRTAPERVKHRVLTAGISVENQPGVFYLVAMMATPTTTERLRVFFPGVTDWRKVDHMPPISLQHLVGLN